MSFENVIQLVGILVAILAAAFSYLFTELSKRNAIQRRLKEKYYLDYIDAVNDVVDSKTNVQTANKSNAYRHLAKAQNQLLLIGSSDVVNALLAFHNYLEITDSKVIDSNLEEHTRLFTILLKSIRADLYKKRDVNSDYPMVCLFAGGRKEDTNKIRC